MFGCIGIGFGCRKITLEARLFFMTIAFVLFLQLLIVEFEFYTRLLQLPKGIHRKERISKIAEAMLRHLYFVSNKSNLGMFVLSNLSNVLYEDAIIEYSNILT